MIDRSLFALWLLIPAALAEDGGDALTLERVVVLSRHNIRSPLSGGGSLLDAKIAAYDELRAQYRAEDTLDAAP